MNKVMNRLVLAALFLLSARPAMAQQRREQKLVLGFGIGRLIPLQPLASADGNTTEYQLDDASTTIISVDYWYTPVIGTRVAYQGIRGRLAQPEGGSFAQVWSGYGGLLLAPVDLGTRRRPFIVLGAGLRRYNVNALVSSGDLTWDIAPRQYRIAGYAGAGGTISIKRYQFVPEAGVFVNEFRHNFPCLGSGCPRQKNTQIDLQLSLNFQLR